MFRGWTCLFLYLNFILLTELYVFKYIFIRWLNSNLRASLKKSFVYFSVALDVINCLREINLYMFISCYRSERQRRHDDLGDGDEDDDALLSDDDEQEALSDYTKGKDHLYCSH